MRKSNDSQDFVSIFHEADVSIKASAGSIPAAGVQACGLHATFPMFMLANPIPRWHERTQITAWNAQTGGI